MRVLDGPAFDVGAASGVLLKTERLMSTFAPVRKARAGKRISRKLRMLFSIAATVPFSPIKLRKLGIKDFFFFFCFLSTAVCASSTSEVSAASTEEVEKALASAPLRSKAIAVASCGASAAYILIGILLTSDCRNGGRVPKSLSS